MDAGEWKIMYINIHSPDVVIFLVDKSICWKGSTHHKTKQKTNPRENRIGVVPIVILNYSLWQNMPQKFLILCPSLSPEVSQSFQTWNLWFYQKKNDKSPSIYNHCWWHVLLFVFRSKNKIFKWCWSGFENKNTLSNEHTHASHLLNCWRLNPKTKTVHLVFCLPTRSPCFKCIQMLHRYNNMCWYVYQNTFNIYIYMCLSGCVSLGPRYPIEKKPNQNQQSQSPKLCGQIDLNYL